MGMVQIEDEFPSLPHVEGHELYIPNPRARRNRSSPRSPCAFMGLRESEISSPDRGHGRGPCCVIGDPWIIISIDEPAWSVEVLELEIVKNRFLMILSIQRRCLLDLADGDAHHALSPGAFPLLAVFLDIKHDRLSIIVRIIVPVYRYIANKKIKKGRFLAESSTI
jgi:hypothetical protein